jgi:hemolysin D
VAQSEQKSANEGQPGEGVKQDHQPKEPGYVAHIKLENPRLMVDGREETLSAGMAVTAEIKTGRRNVISYLLSPLRRYAHEAGRER